MSNTPEDFDDHLARSAQQFRQSQPEGEALGASAATERYPGMKERVGELYRLLNAHVRGDEAVPEMPLGEMDTMYRYAQLRMQDLVEEYKRLHSEPLTPTTFLTETVAWGVKNLYRTCLCQGAQSWAEHNRRPLISRRPTVSILVTEFGQEYEMLSTVVMEFEKRMGEILRRELPADAVIPSLFQPHSDDERTVWMRIHDPVLVLRPWEDFVRKLHGDGGGKRGLLHDLGIQQGDGVQECRRKLLEDIGGDGLRIKVHPNGDVPDGHTRLHYAMLLGIPEDQITVFLVHSGKHERMTLTACKERLKRGR